MSGFNRLPTNGARRHAASRSENWLDLVFAAAGRKSASAPLRAATCSRYENEKLSRLRTDCPLMILYFRHPGLKRGIACTVDGMSAHRRRNLSHGPFRRPSSWRSLGPLRNGLL